MTDLTALPEAQSTKTKSPTKPSFLPMLVVSEPSLVVDCNGIGWWIDPSTQGMSLAFGDRS